MIRQILKVARIEMLEHRRQPWMLAILVFNYILWGAAFIVVVMGLEVLATNSDAVAQVLASQPALGAVGEGDVVANLTRLTTSTFGAVLFTNLPLFVAIMSGYSVLHDRSVGALPFLMLAPLSRLQLLTGKLLGALALPYALHLATVGPVCWLALQYESMQPHAAQLGDSPAWWVAYLLGAPASAMLVGSLGTVISSLARDVRTSMQWISFVIGILSLGFGFVLFDAVKFGVGVELAFVAGALFGTLLMLGLGSRLISRDLAG